MRLRTSATAALLATVVIAGCSTEPAARTSAAPNQAASDMVCAREYPIGSNIPVTKCRTREQIEADKAAATENLRRPQTGGPNAKMGGG
jgi:curli biogenesis system outer membrane secretion channel CsgG